MRLVLLSLCAAMVASTPAFADGARVEVHSGLGWTGGQSANATVGGAIGYDYSLGSTAFAGVEGSIDKVLATGEKARWGTSARLGAKISPNDKLYGVAGYSFGVGPNATHLGAGVEHNFGAFYGKAEYRHFFNEDGARDSNAATLGVGVHF